MTELIVLTKKWGRNFTGATLATQCLVKYWIKEFRRVHVITLECGDYDMNHSIIIQRCNSTREVKRALYDKYNSVVKKEEVTGYSDDHLGYLFHDAGISYFHTYHGNWPDARYINLEFFIKSFYFIPLYKRTIKYADMVFHVSAYMERFTKQWNPNSVVIRNGIDYKKCDVTCQYPKTFLMVGNIDKRKYAYAIKLAKKIAILDPEVAIHVYGAEKDKKIVKALENLSNVTIIGQVQDIPYRAYRGLISTSKIENLPISVCEAIWNQIPVFAFDVGGMSEVVENGRTGYLVSDFDCDSIAERICAYAVSDKLMKIDVSVRSRFDWEYAAQEYMKYFQVHL